jgi:hypothetical protein
MFQRLVRLGRVLAVTAVAVAAGVGWSGAASAVQLSSSAPAGVLYVSLTGSDTNPGTQAQPLRTISAAVIKAEASSPPSSVDVAGGTYGEGSGVTITSSVTIDGGFDPSTWLPSSTQTTTITGAPQAVYADNANGVLLENLTLQASAPSGSGQSSYGLHEVNSANVTLNDVKVSAGNGATGYTDTALAAVGANGTNGAGGGNGKSSGGCTSSYGNGGAGGPSATPGGNGGVGGCSGGNGGNGTPGRTAPGGAPGGAGGAGGIGDSQFDGGGAVGSYGANGTTGSPGTGGTNTLADASSTWAGAAGGSGATGQYGGGGGGGGGGGALTECFLGLFCTYYGGGGGGGGGGGPGPGPTTGPGH